MSNTLQALATEYGLSVLLSAQKDHAVTYELIGALTPDTTEIYSFHNEQIETSYYDDNGVLTFIIDLPIETDFKEYMHKIVILDNDSNVVIECVTPKVSLAKGIGGKITLKTAITGEAGEVIFKHDEYITETELNEKWLPPINQAIATKLDADATAVAASKLAQAITLALTGDVSGSVIIDGSSNVSINVTIDDDSHNHVTDNIDGLQDALDDKLDKTANAVSASKLAQAITLALTGDVSGSAIIDGSSNVSINVTIDDDSHKHVISNVDNLQSTLDSKLGKSSNAVSATRLQTSRKLTFSGDVSGYTYFDGAGNKTITITVKDDSHKHVIGNVDGLQSALNGKSNKSHNHTLEDIDGIDLKSSCVAWVHFNGATVPPTIMASYNISDVIRFDVGKYEVHFAEDLDNRNYAVTGSVRGSGTETYQRVVEFYDLNTDCFVAKATDGHDSETETVDKTVFILVFGGKN